MSSPQPVHSAARAGPGAAAGVTEDMIRAVVHAFYDKVRADPDLGPVFNRVIGDRWDAHLAKLCDFWSSVLLMSGRFRGSPMAAHAAVDGIQPAHFVRWLQLFGQTAHEVCPPECAALFIARAEMIGQSLQMGIAALRDGPFPSRREVRLP